jgi:hypothetical protein
MESWNHGIMNSDHDMFGGQLTLLSLRIFECVFRLISSFLSKIDTRLGFAFEYRVYSNIDRRLTRKDVSVIDQQRKLQQIELIRLCVLRVTGP